MQKIIRAAKLALAATIFAGAIAHGQDTTPKPKKHHKAVIAAVATVAAGAALGIVKTSLHQSAHRKADPIPTPLNPTTRH